jgi:hypothetical protein
MDGKNKALKILRWLLLIALFPGIPIAAGWATWQYAPGHGMTKFIMDVATMRCKQNSGVSSVQRLNPQQFTIVCDNGAHFYDTIIEVKTNEHVGSETTGR